MDKLKSCPFCGSKNPIICEDWDADYLGEQDGNGYFAVICHEYYKGCGSSGGYAEGKEKAIEKWNRREVE